MVHARKWNCDKIIEQMTELVKKGVSLKSDILLAEYSELLYAAYDNLRNLKEARVYVANNLRSQGYVAEAETVLDLNNKVKQERTNIEKRDLTFRSVMEAVRYSDSIPSYSCRISRADTNKAFEMLRVLEQAQDGSERRKSLLKPYSTKIFYSIFNSNSRLILKALYLTTQNDFHLNVAEKALEKAIRYFEPRAGNTFSTYAIYIIKKLLVREIRKRENPISLNSSRVSDGSGLEKIIPAKYSEPNMDKREFHNALRESLDISLARLSVKDRRIIEKRFGLNGYFKPKTYEQIGEEEKPQVSKQDIWGLYQKSIKRLRADKRLADLANLL